MEKTPPNTSPMPVTDPGVIEGAPMHVIDAVQGPGGVWSDPSLPALPSGAKTELSDKPAGPGVIEGTTTETALVPTSSEASAGTSAAAEETETGSRWQRVRYVARGAGEAILDGLDVGSRVAERLSDARVFEAAQDWAAGKSGRAATVVGGTARVGEGLADARRRARKAGLVDQPGTEAPAGSAAEVERTPYGTYETQAPKPDTLERDSYGVYERTGEQGQTGPEEGSTESADVAAQAGASETGIRQGSREDDTAEVKVSALTVQPPEDGEGAGNAGDPDTASKALALSNAAQPPARGVARVPYPNKGSASVPKQEALRPDMTYLGPDGKPYYLDVEGGEALLDAIVARGRLPNATDDEKAAAGIAAHRLRNARIQETDYATPFAAVHHGDGGGYRLAEGAASNIDPRTGKGAVYGSKGQAGQPDLKTGTEDGVYGGINGTAPRRAVYGRTNADDFALGPDGKPVRAAQKSWVKGIAGLLKSRRPPAPSGLTAPEMAGAAFRDDFDAVFTPTGRRYVREERGQAAAQAGNVGLTPDQQLEAMFGGKVSSDSSTRGAYAPQATRPNPPGRIRRWRTAARDATRRVVARATGQQP